MKKIISIIIATLACVHAFGEDFDFCVTTPDGQALYYNIVDSVAHKVAIASPRYQIIPEYHYDGWSGYTKPSGSISIPSSVAYNGTDYIVSQIAGAAFSECFGITSVSIPNTIESIGAYSFYQCTGLSSITIPPSVQQIWSGAFSECANIENVYFNAVNCESNAHPYYENSGTFNPSKGLFYNCVSLSMVSFGDNVTRIPSGIFINCVNIPSVVFPQSVSVIDDYAFYGCSNIQTISLHPNIDTLGIGVFANCAGLHVVNFNSPNCYVKSAPYPFYGCSSISSINIGNLVSDIPNYLFYGSCSESNFQLVIPNNVNTIGDGSFGSCSGITSLVFPSSMSKIGSYAFEYCSGILTISIPNSVNYIGAGAFNGCSSVTSVTIGENVDTIGSCAFSGMNSLATVNYNAVNAIAESPALAVFSENTLSAVNFGPLVSVIPSQLIAYCPNMTGTLTLPSSLTEIGDGNFVSCSLSGELVIPASVVRIGNNSFFQCNFSKIESYNPIPPIVQQGSTFFFGCWDKPLYVPYESISAYSSAVGWSNFHTISGIGGDDNESIGDIFADRIEIYSYNGHIFVDGLDDTMDVFDMTGRNVRNEALPAGVYMVKIGNHLARKVVVIR